MDVAHTDPVVARLELNGYNVIRYHADRVALGKAALCISLIEGEVDIVYEGERITPESLAAAWSRRPGMFGPVLDDEDLATRMCMEDEWMASQQLILDSVPDQKWLNPPPAMRRASRKLFQLAMASSVGFRVPNTVVGNQWEDILPTLNEGPGGIIYKGFRGKLYEGSEQKAVYSTILDNSGDPDNPPLEGSPYPGMWQDYQAKAKEWRITVVGDDTFDTAIYTTEVAKDDWRRHQMTPEVTLASETFPDEEKAKCFALLRKYGLRYGAFDFTEGPDGEITFLEMNPNGQYYWVEQRLGLPISDAISNELLRVARS